MNIKQEDKNGVAYLSVEGSINTITSLEFKDILLLALDTSKEIVVDMEQIDMISSAGLRIMLLGVKRAASQQKKLVFTKFNDDIKEVFEMTGILDFLTVE